MHVRLRRSAILTAVLGVAHACAIGAAWLIDLPVWIKAGVGLLILVSAALSIRRSGLLLGAHAIVELEAGEGGTVSYRDARGWHRGRVLGSSFVSPWLTVLNLRGDDGSETRHVLIVPDNSDPEAFRGLRVVLRWSGGTKGPRASAGPQ